MAENNSDNTPVIAEAEANAAAPAPKTDASTPETAAPATETAAPALDIAAPAEIAAPVAPAQAAEPALDTLDDISAELARIEQMTQEEAAAIPSLDDGSDDGDEQAETTAALDPGPAESEKPHDEELAAALAEVEQISSKPKAAGEEPVEGAQTAAPEAGSAAKEDKPKKPPQFKIGKQEPAESHEIDPASLPKSAWGRRVYSFVAGVLDAFNAPFGEMSAATRNRIGAVGATMIIVALLVRQLMPIILPNYDAIQFIQERRAALDKPPPEAEKKSEGEEGKQPEAKEESHSESHSEGHSEAKPAAKGH
jgi:hypothetical protein